VPEELPQIQFNQVITGRGEIHVEELTSPVTRFTLSRIKHGFRTPWEFETVVSEDDRGEFYKAVKRGSLLRFVGKTFTGSSIEVPNLRMRRWELGNGAFTGVASAALIDSGPLPTKPNRQIVTIDLSPTSMALEEKRFLTRYYTGELKEDDALTPSDKEKVLYWDTSYGRMTLVCYYAWENAQVGETQSIVRIPVSTLQLRLENDATSADARQLAESIEKEIEGPLRLISLLNRGHVRWTRIHVSSETKDDNGRTTGHDLDWHRPGALGDERSHRDWGLANPYDMVPDGLNTVVTSLNQSPYRDVLLTAMVYIVTAYDDRIAELSLVSSFTALETITNGIGEVDGTDHIMPEGGFRKLKKHLEGEIQSHIEPEKLSANLFPLIRVKLGELNRSSIVPRLCALIERHKVEWKMLWPEADLEESVRRMIKVRNEFVHTGHIDMEGRAYIASRRARMLGEQLIWRMLGGDWKWEHVSSFSETDRLIAWEKELDLEESARPEGN